MTHLYSLQPAETISLHVESSPVWEMILGICGYTYSNLRHTFELDEKWAASQHTMPAKLTENLNVIEQTNVWYALIMLQNEFSAPSVQYFTKLLSQLPAEQFYEIILPYKDRDSEPFRKSAAARAGYHEQQSFEEYASLFNGHEYLHEYVNSLSLFSLQDLRKLFTQTLEEWRQWICQGDEWNRWLQGLSFEQKQNSSPNRGKPIEEIERITNGIHYVPEPSIWTVKLIPQISYRPWTLEIRTADTKLFFYPLKEEYLFEPGVPSNELIRGHKALGDELRLKLLYQLTKGSLSLQELSIQFALSKSTLHHQLSILKAAKFIRADKGVYSVNEKQIGSFTGHLTKYLGILL